MIGLRVLLVSHHYGNILGGATLADLGLARALQGHGFRVEILFYEDVLPPWVKGTWAQLIFPWAVAVSVLRDRRRFEILESTAGDAWVLTLLLRVLRSRRPLPLLSVRTHGLEHKRAEAELVRLRLALVPLRLTTYWYHFRYRLWEVARDLRNADVVFLLNQEDAAYATAQLAVSAGKVHAIPNGVPPDLLDLPESGPSEEAPFRLLFLGAWSPKKGANLLPIILRRLVQHDPRFQLVCAGVGVPAAAVTQDFVPEDRSRVTVVSSYARGELPAILAAAGVFLFPSPAEGCSLALLEAMAAGLVPITTRTGYAGELIDPGESGFLLDAQDVDGFVAAALALAKDPRRMTEMAIQARRAVSKLSWHAVAALRIRAWQAIPSRAWH